MVMWFNCMQFVGEDGVTVGELEQLARTPTNLDGMQRWGYIYLSPPHDEKRAKPQSSWLIRATTAGRNAQEIWRPLVGTIEARWQDRFGKDEIDRLRKSLAAVTSKLDPGLPDCLPILGYGLAPKLPRLKQKSVARDSAAIQKLPLPALLSKVLLAFALDFERESEVSLAISANILRLISDEGIRPRDLPQMSGISKEAIAMAAGFLKRHDYATEEPESPGSRTKLLKLTPNGPYTPGRHRKALAQAVRQRNHRGAPRITGKADRRIHSREVPTLSRPEPYPEGWRASIPRPTRLPHFPAVLHRGGFPDGS
jgi:hypothetical protein